MGLEIIKKAWKVSIKDVDNTYECPPFLIWAENRNEARHIGLGEALDMGYEVKTYAWETREPKYTDVIAHRDGESDIVLYKGIEVCRGAIHEIEWVQERDDNARKLVEENPNQLCLIWAGCYSAYWGPNRAGYYSDKHRAGKYTAKEAYDIVIGNDYSRQEIVEKFNVDEYNKEIDEKIKELEKRKYENKTFKEA